MGNEQPSRLFPSFKNVNFRKKEKEKAFFFLLLKVSFLCMKTKYHYNYLRFKAQALGITEMAYIPLTVNF